MNLGLSAPWCAATVSFEARSTWITGPPLANCTGCMVAAEVGLTLEAVTPGLRVTSVNVEVPGLMLFLETALT